MQAPSTKNQYSALLVGGELRETRVLQRALKTVGVSSQAEARLEDAAWTEADLVVVDMPAIPPAELEAIRTRFSDLEDGQPRPNLILLFGDGKLTQIVDWLQDHSAAHIVGKNGGVHARDFAVTLRKIVSGDIFGLEKYFGWGVAPARRRASRSSQRAELTTFVREYTLELGLEGRAVSRVCRVADELVTNALFHAPVDEQGRPAFFGLPPAAEITLPEGKELTLSIACDGSRLGLSVQDPFGSLDAARVQDYLAKCIRRDKDQIDDKASGAGLGLFMAFDAASALIANISTGEQTEVIGLFELESGCKDQSVRAKSLSLFHC